MNQPREIQEFGGAALNNLIDRLVDGELPDRERTVLLRRLDTEPEGWRYCALAFLEAQSWREALTPVTAAGLAEPSVRAVQGRQVPQRWRYSARLTALAASLTLTFVLGWTLHGNPTLIARDDRSSAQANDDRPALPVESQQPELYAQAQPDAVPSPSTGQAVGLAPVIKEWEQLGYQAETQTRLASLKLRDGTQVEVPVHKVRLHYIRDRTY